MSDEWPETAWEPPCGKTGSYAGERDANFSLNDTVGLRSTRRWMTSDQVVIVTHSLERWVVVAVDKYHGNIGENVVTKLAEDQIGLSSL